MNLKVGDIVSCKHIYSHLYCFTNSNGTYKVLEICNGERYPKDEIVVKILDHRYVKELIGCRFNVNGNHFRRIGALME